VGARTSALIAISLAFCSVAAADTITDDAVILGREPGWRVEDVQLRTSFLDQRGRGFQSQEDRAPGVPGSERMYVVQPSALIRLRQSARVTHEITIPVDAITAASPDAVDAMSSASRRNVAVDLDVRSAIILDDKHTLTTRVMAHGEEPMGGGTVGAGIKRSLADDNATVAINGSFTFDIFDDHDRFGNYLGKTHRETYNINASVSQLLSPTTVVDASYGLTFQHGRLETTWNAVPTADNKITDEVLPKNRIRQAATGRIAQHIPLTRSTVKSSYRYYRDDLGIRAHTVDGAYYQYLVPWLYTRAALRYHSQRAPDFFTTALAPGFNDVAPFRTADSDLASLRAIEWTLSLTSVPGRGPLRAWSASGEVMRYTRDNDMRILVVSLTLGRVL
jgi:hypothetical protein